MPIVKIQLRRGTSAEWAASDPILAIGEPGVDETLQRLKLGNGVDHWSALEFIADAEAAAILAEASERDAADAALQVSLDAESAARVAAISAEASARAGADATLLPKAGGTLSGPLVLAGDPTANLHAVPRQYVQAQVAAAVSGLLGGAPAAALDTIAELAAALTSDESAAAALTIIVAQKVAKASNLSDLADAVAARTNLGLDSAATHPASDFATPASVAAEGVARAAADALLVPLAQKGAAGGVASLDGAGTIPDAQIPASITRDSELAAAIAALVNSSPTTLDTLNELATALGDDPNFATTMAAALGGKQPLDADLTAIAALVTTAYGRAFLALADAAAGRAALALGTAATRDAGVANGVATLGADGKVPATQSGTSVFDSTSTPGQTKLPTDLLILGVQASPTGARLEIYNSETGVASARPIGSHQRFDANPASAPGSAIDYHGIDLLVYTDNANANSNVNLYPLEANAQNSGNGSVGRMVAIYGYANNLGNGNVAVDMSCVQVLMRNRGTGTVAESRGLHIRTPVNDGGGTITLHKGINLETVAGVTGVTAAYAIYSAGGPSWHAGDFKIGDTAAATSPGARLHVLGAASGVGAILKANATTPGDFLQLLSSGGNKLVQWYSTGALNIDPYGASQVHSNAGIGLRVAGTTTVNLALKKGPAPTGTGDFIQLLDTNGNTMFRFNRDGYPMNPKNAAPADADVNTGEMAVWFDSTNGAAKLMVKAKQANGTVVTGSLALA